MTWDAFNQAVKEFKQANAQADQAVREFGHMMPGRLQRHDSDTLSKLKKELRSWDSVRNRWQS